MYNKIVILLLFIVLFLNFFSALIFPQIGKIATLSLFLLPGIMIVYISDEAKKERNVGNKFEQEQPASSNLKKVSKVTLTLLMSLLLTLPLWAMMI